MRKKTKLLGLLFLLTVFLSLPSNTVCAAKLSNMSGKQIISTLKTNGFPIHSYNIYSTNKSDPNHLLGKPHQYKCKIDFQDRTYMDDDIECSGTVEIFKNSSDATRRRKYLKTIYDAVPSWSMRMYQYSNVLLRIDYSVASKRAKYYKNAFSDMSKGKTPRFPITINKKSKTIYPGKTYTLKHNILSKTAKWSSSNKKGATVSKAGKVTAKKKGTAVISAKFNGYTVKCKVTVKNPPVKINKEYLTLKMGESYTLKLLNTSKRATWISDNERVATVSANGKVTAKASGSTEITAFLGSYCYSCEVIVPQEGIAMPGITVSTINWEAVSSEVTFRIQNNTAHAIEIYKTAYAYDDDYELLKAMEMPYYYNKTILPGQQDDVNFVAYSSNNVIYNTQRITFFFDMDGVKYRCEAEYNYEYGQPYKFSYYREV